MFLAGAIVGCSSFGVSTPSGSAPNAFPILDAAFVKHAGRIAFPNVTVPAVDALSGAGLGPNSTAGANDLEAAGVDVASGGPYDGMLASITAYLPTQIKLPGTSSAPSSVFAPYLAPTNGSCLTVGILYADMGSGTTASLVAKDTCANTVLYSTPITSSFASKYIQQDVTPANVTVPILKVLVYTSDPTPTASSTWNAYLYDLSTQAYDLVATRKGISTTLAGGTLWTSSIRTGSCPVLPQISVVSSYLYDGANQTYTAVAPSLTGTTSTPLPTASDSCFKSAKPPATFTFVLAHPNDMWNVVSATAAPSPTPVPTSTPFLVTVAKGGSGALPDGSGSVSFGAGALPYDAYVTLTYMPTANASPPSANWTAFGPQLHIAFAPAATPSPSVGSKATATTGPSPTPAPGTVTIQQTLPKSIVPMIGYQSMTEISVGEVVDGVNKANIPLVPSVSTIKAAGQDTIQIATLAKPVLTQVVHLATLDMFNLVQTAKSSVCPTHPNLGLRYWNYATETWAPGAPPYVFIHPLVLFHGITSCVEDTFTSTTIEGLQAEGGYDAVLGEDYDWTQPPDSVIPNVVSNLNALGPFQHIDLMAHSYGSLISLGAAPQLNTKSIDNFILVNGPLNGSFLQNPDFVNSYTLFWPFAFAGFNPQLPAQTFAAQFNTATWRKGFMPNNPEIAGFRSALEKAPDAPIRVIKVASTLSFPIGPIDVSFLYQVITDGLVPGPNDGIVGQSSALSPDVVGTNNTVNLANQAILPSKTFALTSPSTDHITSLADPTIDAIGIGNNLATVFANSDYTSQTLPALGGAYVVMKGLGSTHLLGFLDAANPGSTITVDSTSVPANLTVSPSSVSTVTSLGSASSSNFISVKLANDSTPALPVLFPTRFGSESPTATLRFNYTNSQGTVTDAYSLAYYLLPSSCSASMFPCLPSANGMSLKSADGVQPVRAAASRVPGLRVFFFPKTLGR